MHANYVDTPSTERGDTTSFSHAPHVDFSMVQPFASPSKNPAEDLRSQMRGLRNASEPTRTPRARNTLLDRRNVGGVARQEFTPLLKSAKRNLLVQRSILEDKENTLTNGIPPIPALLRASYRSIGGDLPMESSMLEVEVTTSSVGGKDATLMPPGASSSMLSSTPMPELPKRGEGGVLDQGNVLTLRDQEAKLDQIQKDNFGLKLKIHFLEEALKKTGSEYQQATLRENVELRTEKCTIEADLKKQREKLQVAEKEMEEYRLRYEEYKQTVKKRHVNERDAEEVERLQKLAEESQKAADEREQELEEMRQQLEEAQQGQHDDEEVRGLKEDIEELEREVRDRDGQLDSKDEELGALQEQLKAAKANTRQSEHLQQDIDELEAELKEKDEEVDAKDARIAELEERLNGVYDREKSTKKLRSDVSTLEAQLREKDQALDEVNEQLRSLQRQSRIDVASLESQLRDKDDALAESEDRVRTLQSQAQSADLGSSSQLRQREEDLRNAQRELADKDGEVRALQERLQTARGSWDAEAQQTDARMQEKDRLIREKETRLREKTTIIEQRDDELEDLQKRVRTAEAGQGEAARKQTQHIQEQTEQIRELQEKLRINTATSQAKLNEKDGLIDAREGELRTLQNRISTLQMGESGELRVKSERIQELESEIKKNEGSIADKNQQIISLKTRLGAMETPSKKDGLMKQQAEQIRSLQQKMQKLEQDKDVELDGLEQQLDILETQNAALQKKAERVKSLELELEESEGQNAELQRKVERLGERAKAADKDQSFFGHQGEELEAKQQQIETLEDEIDQLQVKLQRAVEQRQSDVANLERDLHRLRKAGDDKAEDTQKALTRLGSQLEADHTEAKQSLEDEILVLESSLDDLQIEKVSLESRIQELESDLQKAWRAKEHGTPARERNELRLRLRTVENERNTLQSTITALEAELESAQQARASGTPVRERNELRGKLRDAESKISRFQSRVEDLESELAFAQQEKTIAEERQDLHDQLKQAKIEAEELRLRISEKDRKISSSSKKEGELRGQLHDAQLQLEDAHNNMTELETRLEGYVTREKNLRAQLKDLKNSHVRLEDVEHQLGERKTSSSGHARREAELRVQLRDAKIELESAQIEAQEKGDRIQAMTKKEQELRERFRKNKAEDTVQLDARSRLDDAELEIQDLQARMQERERALVATQKREADLKSKVRSLAQAAENERTLDQKQLSTQLESTDRKHQAELRGLAKQIQFLRALCEREQGFRKDLVFTKRWFLMQVDVYNQCNQVDLGLLEEMGITPDASFRQRKHSLKTVGLAVMAGVRIRKRMEDWRENKKVKEALNRKLEEKRRAKGRGIVGAR